MQHVASTDCVAVYHGKYRLRNFANAFVQVEYIQARNAVFSDVASNPFDVLVSPAAKSLITFAREHHHAHVAALAANIKGLNHLRIGLWPKGVVNLRAVDGNLCYALKKFKFNVGILLDGGPCDVLHSGIKIRLQIDPSRLFLKHPGR